jgi:hypothetical protein
MLSCHDHSNINDFVKKAISYSLMDLPNNMDFLEAGLQPIIARANISDAKRAWVELSSASQRAKKLDNYPTDESDLDVINEKIKEFQNHVTAIAKHKIEHNVQDKAKEDDEDGDEVVSQKIVPRSQSQKDKRK